MNTLEKSIERMIREPMSKLDGTDEMMMNDIQNKVEMILDLSLEEIAQLKLVIKEGWKSATILLHIREIVFFFKFNNIITNVDGIEWKRDKWSLPAKFFLRLSEFVAVKFSHNIIADNQGISEHIFNTYKKSSQVISYGGDHALMVESKTFTENLPKSYALSLCRIEPENNVDMILEAFSKIFCWFKSFLHLLENSESSFDPSRLNLLIL